MQMYVPLVVKFDEIKIVRVAETSFGGNAIQKSVPSLVNVWELPVKTKRKQVNYE